MLPQLRGLGTSPTAREFGLDGEREARQYVDDTALRERLVTTVALVHGAVCERGAPLVEVMGSTLDAMKCVSCLTLFEHVARTTPEPRPPDVARLAHVAAEILALAEVQGLPPCAFTRRALRA